MPAPILSRSPFALYHPDVHSPMSTPPMFTYLPQYPWQNQQLHLFPANPYPILPPPPNIAHKVWILDCKSCGTFLTNRGMKAVLLLRPNVSLYSCDALPVNCSAYTSNPDAFRPPSSCSSPSSQRTCECLTQTLCCHGCGSTIGYMIVVPCIRCTSSITTTNRATNGHRFVFHSGEIIGTERHYIPDEPGVIPFEPTSVAMSPSATMSSAALPSLFHPPAVAPHPHADRDSFIPPPMIRTSVQSAPGPRSEYLPTPPLDTSDLSPVSSTSPSPVTSVFSFRGVSHGGYQEPYPTARPFSPSALDYPSPVTVPSHTTDNATTSDIIRQLISPGPTLSSHPSPAPPRAHGMTAERMERPASSKLKAGDVLFWHHLARQGEIPGVAEDPRARRKNGETSRKLMFDR